MSYKGYIEPTDRTLKNLLILSSEGSHLSVLDSAELTFF